MVGSFVFLILHCVMKEGRTYVFMEFYGNTNSTGVAVGEFEQIEQSSDYRCVLWRTYTSRDVQRLGGPPPTAIFPGPIPPLLNDQSISTPSVILILKYLTKNSFAHTTSSRTCNLALVEGEGYKGGRGEGVREWGGGRGDGVSKGN